jgi:nucleotide-binding universal stress UspA family protein
MFQRIMLAWDGSELALRAFDVAIDVTRRYEAELVAVSVAHFPAHAETAADRLHTAQTARRYLEATFADVADRALRAGVEVAHEIVDGEVPERALLEHAREHGFDLIVCGHHHDGRTGRLLLTGITQHLLDDGSVPVLVVNEHDPRP